MLSPGHGNTASAKRAKAKKFDFRKYDKQMGRECYLVYRYKGEIRVRHGIKGGGLGHVFYPDNHPSWMTNIPEEYMKVTSAGRVLVKHEDDILEAVEMLREHYRKKVENVQHTSSTTMKNIMECVEGRGYTVI